MISMLATEAGPSPLVLDSPHSGTWYPPDFGACCDPAILRRAEDTHVDKLYAFAPAFGATWLEARFPRSYLDVNRDLGEIDLSMFDPPWTGAVATDPAVLSKVRLGKGLVWKTTDEGIALYDRKLTPAEVQERIDRCWVPYHATLKQAIEDAHARHGFSLHINCHSMPSVASRFATDFPGEAHPDFVVGNRDETTSSGALAQLVCGMLAAGGFTVGYNHPYKGVELVRRYGDPSVHRHSIQLEINRRLYMDETTLEIHAGFARLQRMLAGLVACLVQIDPRTL